MELPVFSFVSNDDRGNYFVLAMFSIMYVLFQYWC